MASSVSGQGQRRHKGALGSFQPQPNADHIAEEAAARYQGTVTALVVGGP